MVPVRRLNHAVLYVSELEWRWNSYHRVFGMDVIAPEQAGPGWYLRAKGSDNHQDSGLLALGPEASQPPRGSTGPHDSAAQPENNQGTRRGAR